MKKYTLLIIAAVAALFAFTPSSAEARDYCGGERRIVGYSYGAPIYSGYQIIGRDAWGRPIGRWVTQRSYHRGGYCPPTRYSSYRGGYGYRPYGYGYNPYYRRSGVNLSFSYFR